MQVSEKDLIKIIQTPRFVQLLVEMEAYPEELRLPAAVASTLYILNELKATNMLLEAVAKVANDQQVTIDNLTSDLENNQEELEELRNRCLRTVH